MAGIDNIPLAAFTTPPLTTVEQPIAQQGEEAARFLLERIGGRSQDLAATMEWLLIVQQSTDLRLRSLPDRMEAANEGRKEEGGDEAD